MTNTPFFPNTPHMGYGLIFYPPDECDPGIVLDIAPYQLEPGDIGYMSHNEYLDVLFEALRKREQVLL